MTNPAFAVSEAELDRASAEFEHPPLGWLPARWRNAIFRKLLRGSLLASGLGRSRGTFLPGLDTYLLKLGDQIAAVSEHPADRKITASLPALAMRLRLL